MKVLRRPLVEEGQRAPSRAAPVSRARCLVFPVPSAKRAEPRLHAAYEQWFRQAGWRLCCLGPLTLLGAAFLPVALQVVPSAPWVERLVGWLLVVFAEEETLRLALLERRVGFQPEGTTSGLRFSG